MLSAQIDIGRTYFPNKLHGEVRFGFRRRIYDWLVCAYRILEVQTGELTPDAKEHLTSLRRQFSVDRQEALNAIEQLGPAKDSNIDRYDRFGFMDWNMSHKVLTQAEAFIAEHPSGVSTPERSDRRKGAVYLLVVLCTESAS